MWGKGCREASYTHVEGVGIINANLNAAHNIISIRGSLRGQVYTALLDRTHPRSSANTQMTTPKSVC
ncbi:MAG: hypothetical protein QW514_05450 [Thermoprotei archaeon]